MIHKHGPCSKFSQDKESSTSTSHTQILDQDEYRVASIRSRLAKNLTNTDKSLTDSKTTLPAKSGKTIGTGNYIVTVGLGTPKRDLTFIFDTGSDLTWTQCEPCARHCYDQIEPIFNPSMSKSYTNISCSAATCNELKTATGVPPACSASTCLYGIQYGDQSYSVGFFAQDQLSLTPTDVFDDFLFGCGQNNQGLFVGAAGLLGLGRNRLSFVSQTAGKYEKVFSYCLPSTSSLTGYLTFGSGDAKSVKYTPSLVNSQGPSFYFLNLIAISVGGDKLSTPESVFSTAGMVIDSGTVISRLPPTAYSDMRTAFQNLMSKYPKAPAASILDTCYDFSKYDTVDVPTINLHFSDGVEMDLDPTGIFYVLNKSQVCLAFAGNRDSTSIGILGNVQQKTFDVVYDDAGGRVGFGPGGCK